MTITERIGPAGSPRRTRNLIWLCIVLMAAGFGWLAAWNLTYQTKTDQVVGQLVSDSNAYRKALTDRGVNPNTIAPPPTVRTEPLAEPGPMGPIGGVGPSGAPGLNGINGTNGKDSTVPGPIGSTGPVGPPPPCAAEPTQCRGEKGDTGDKGDSVTGDKGEPGAAGRGITSVMLRESSPGLCELTGTYSDGADWTAGGAMIPCVATVPTTGPQAAARRPAVTTTPTAGPRPSATPTVSPSPSPVRRVLPRVPLDWTMLALVIPFGMRRLGEAP